MQNLGLALLVSMVGGLIGYLGRNLSKKIGKKKRSLFEMKPRPAADFIAFLTGASIGLVTFALLHFLHS